MNTGTVQPGEDGTALTVAASTVPPATVPVPVVIPAVPDAPAAHVMTVGPPIPVVPMTKARADRRVTSSTVMTAGFVVGTIGTMFVQMSAHFPNVPWLASAALIIPLLSGAIISIGNYWITQQRRTDADTLQNTNMVTPPLPVQGVSQDDTTQQ